MADTATASWPRRLVDHFLFMWHLKAFGTMAFIAIFFAGYFAVLRHPLSPAIAMPLTALDRWVAFTPAALPAYVSLWFYVSLAPALIGNLRALLLFGLWVALLCLFGLAVFWLFPTQTPPFDVNWADYPQLATIKGMDAAGNAFPSLHVASAVFSAFWLDRTFTQLKAPSALRLLSALHCALIIWSTIAIRQHVVLDAVGGLLLGSVFATLSLRHAGTSLAVPLVRH